MTAPARQWPTSHEARVCRRFAVLVMAGPRLHANGAVTATRSLCKIDLSRESHRAAVTGAVIRLLRHRVSFEEGPGMNKSRALSLFAVATYSMFLVLGCNVQMDEEAGGRSQRYRSGRD